MFPTLMHVKSKIISTRKTYWFFMFAVLPVLLFVSCDNRTHNKDIKQGSIQYEISYLDQSKKIPVYLMPKTMVLKFNEDFSSFTIEDPLGIFNVRNIHNHAENRHITLMKVFNEKYYYIGESNEPPILFNPNTNYKIKYFDDTARLTGFLCKKAEITDNQEKFDILFTKDINISRLNKNTPYHAINGMLLNFRIQIKNLNMQLSAKKFDDKTVKNEQFEVPKDYKLISRDQMEYNISKILP